VTGIEREIVLTPRLEAAYALLESGDTVADIGTDHAYLPARLILDGKYRRAVASDVAPGPLENAGRTLAALGLSDRISLRLAPGLKGLSEGEADAVCVAGMGGELIASILKDGPRPDLAVLQPMTREEKLRRFLAEEGYRIEKERLAREGERIYTVLRVRFTGEISRPREARTYLGRVLEDNPPALAKAYLSKKKAALYKAESGHKSAGQEEEAAAFRALREEIEEYEKGF